MPYREIIPGPDGIRTLTGAACAGERVLFVLTTGTYDAAGHIVPSRIEARITPTGAFDREVRLYAPASYLIQMPRGLVWQATLLPGDTALTLPALHAARDAPPTATNPLLTLATALLDAHNRDAYAHGGTTGGATGDVTYRHVQMTPSTTWVVPHNLGKYPSVSVVDTERRAILIDPAYPDVNTCVLAFSVPFSGECYCN